MKIYMNKELTSNQNLVFQELSSFVKKRGFAPTFSELKASLSRRGLKLKSINSVKQYLDSLEEKGFIKKLSEKRGIKILKNTSEDFVEIPFLGVADCGEPLSFADDQIEEYVSISSKYLDDDDSFDYFIIKAKGDSMNKEKISDGDYVLVKRFRGEPEDGDNVVASVNGTGTIKKFRRKDDTVALSPSSTNSKHQPILLHPDDQVNVCGKVKKVFNFAGENK